MKPRYRIIETADENGKSQWSVQERKWIFWVSPSGRYPGMWGSEFGCYHNSIEQAEKEIEVIKSQRIANEKVVKVYE